MNGKRIGDISFAVQRYVEAHGYSVVREMVGHGSAAACEEPQVPNFDPGRSHPRAGHDAGDRTDDQPGTADIEVAADQ